MFLAMRQILWVHFFFFFFLDLWELETSVLGHMCNNVKTQGNCTQCSIL